MDTTLQRHTPSPNVYSITCYDDENKYTHATCILHTVIIRPR
jgi:hypothetical protein